jgi:heptosyltransferase I
MKVLIVRLSAIGDVIHTIPSLVALKESFPDWRISWLVEETSAPLLEGHPCLEKVFVTRRNWRRNRHSPGRALSGVAGLLRVWREVRAERFDLVLEFQGLIKSGLWAWFSGAPRRLGHGKTREFSRLFLTERAGNGPALDPAQSVIQRNLDLVRHLGADVSQARYLLPEPSGEHLLEADRLLPAGGKPRIAFCPFSAWPTKNWPVEHWQALAARLKDRFQILLIGSAAERSRAGEIVSGVADAVNLAGLTSLPVLAEVFRRCRMVVGADTGPAHLATAVNGPPVLMLFGATPWRRTGPFGEKHRTLSLDLPCQPCFERKCPLKHFNCLRQLTPEAVVAALNEFEPAGKAGVTRPGGFTG